LDTGFRLSLIRNLDSVIQNSAKLKLEKVGETDFATAKSYLKKHAEVIPKLTDWTSIVLMRRNNISKILSLDGDFRDVRSLAEFNWVERINQGAQVSPNP
jgi:predicted nucleic acid-binding protein